MGVYHTSGVRQGRRAMTVLGSIVCMITVVSGVVDVTIVSKYQFFEEPATTWLYCYNTGSLIDQEGYQFGVEVDTGSGTEFPPQRYSGLVPDGVIIVNTAGDSRVGAFSCKVRTTDGRNQTEKAIAFKMKSQADVWPVAFTVTANIGETVTLQMVQRSSRNGTLLWRKDGVDGSVLGGQHGLNLTIAGVRSSDEGIYECYYQGDADRKQGIMRLIVRGCPLNKWDLSCTDDCLVCYNGGVCDDNTGECVCPPGFHGLNCESAYPNNKIGRSCTKECDGGDCTGQLLCVMDPYDCSCAPGLMGIECNTVCPDGRYGAGCTQTCHCADGPTVCDKKTGACTRGCQDTWAGDSCQIATVSFGRLFDKEEGRFFGDETDQIAAYNNIDADECARRCVQGYGSYDGISPPCLSFNHRPEGSPEGGSAGCWLLSGNKDTVLVPGPAWDMHPHRSHFHRKDILTPQDCTDIFALGMKNSQVYSVGYPQPFQVYCDMGTDGGGWTVIQLRQDGSVPFDKTWTEYVQGFGSRNGEYWLGLENIHSLTTKDQNELYVILEDWEDNTAYAKYSTFFVGDADGKYRAMIGGYSGNATDSLNPHDHSGRHSINSRRFSTTDQDNDGVDRDCAGTFGQGGWWYTPSCGWAMLNGHYLTGCSVPYPGSCSNADGIVWKSWKGYTYSLKKTTMMIRRVNFPASSLGLCQNGGNLTSGPEESGLYICACAPGWNGPFCERECSGTYGPDCTHICGHCYNGQTCNSSDGTCPTGGLYLCAAGYYGKKCHQECSETYGPDCTHTCGHCYNGQTCNSTDGTCPTGGLYLCAAGHNGSKCDEDCSGTYRPDCSIPCGHCYEEHLCDRFNGSCPNGGDHICLTGYHGAKCDQDLPDEQAANVSVAPIVGGTVSALLVILFVIGIVWYRKRRTMERLASTDVQIDMMTRLRDGSFRDEPSENPKAFRDDPSPLDNEYTCA